MFRYKSQIPNFNNNPLYQPIVQAINLAINKYNSHPTFNGQLEFEIRFGHFEHNGFKSNISVAAFNRITELAINNGYHHTEIYAQVESMTHGSGNIRKIVQDDRLSWQFKKNYFTADIKVYGIRFSINTEYYIDEYSHFLPTYTRIYTRHRYTVPKIGTIDLTLVKGQNNKLNYEMEFEVNAQALKDVSLQKTLINFIQTIYLTIMNSHLVYDIPTKYAVLTAFNKFMGSHWASKGLGHQSIDRTVVAYARPLKYKDLVWGGLVGNSRTSYTLAYKTDGIRTFVFIYQNSIWLISGSGDINLVHRQIHNDFNNTILDCEAVPYNRRNFDNQAATAKFWLYVLDGIRIADTDISKIPDHIQRLSRSQPLVNYFHTNNLIRLETKNFVSIDTPEKLFNTVVNYEKRLTQLQYQTDGYIFIPTHTPYITSQPNPDTLPLTKRCLNRIPEIVKWKPTTEISLDLLYELDDIGTIQLLTSRRLHDKSSKKKFELVPFVGSKLNPFDLNMLENNDMLSKAISGNVVEFIWQNDKLVAKGIRTDKVFPNTEDVVIDNWDTLFNPIDIDVLEGFSMKLMRKYHNRVKRGLFQKAVNIISSSSSKVTKTLLDIGSGRGGDLMVMNTYYDKIVLVEPNVDHIVELLTRLLKIQSTDDIYILLHSDAAAQVKIEFINEHVCKFIQNVTDIPNNITSKFFILQSGGENTTLIKSACQRFLGGPARVISSMFSLSFFWQSANMLKELVQTLIECSHNQAVFILTTVDGNAIQQVFRPMLGGPPPLIGTDLPSNSGSMNLDILENKNYRIQYHDVDNTGQKITPYVNIRIKDSIVGTDVQDQTEWLVRMSDLTMLLEPYGFEQQLYHRLQDEYLLSPAGKHYTQFMYSGIYVRNLATNLTKTIVVDDGLSEIMPTVSPIETLAIVLPTITTMSLNDQPISILDLDSLFV